MVQRYALLRVPFSRSRGFSRLVRLDGTGRPNGAARDRFCPPILWITLCAEPGECPQARANTGCQAMCCAIGQMWREHFLCLGEPGNRFSCQAPSWSFPGLTGARREPGIARWTAPRVPMSGTARGIAARRSPCPMPADSFMPPSHPGLLLARRGGAGGVWHLLASRQVAAGCDCAERDRGHA